MKDRRASLNNSRSLDGASGYNANLQKTNSFGILEPKFHQVFVPDCAGQESHVTLPDACFER